MSRRRAGKKAEPEVAKVKRTLTIKLVQMPEEMQTVAVKVAEEALGSNPIEKDVASHVKTRFDSEFGGTWHCIVGKNFGCSVTHDTEYLIFFAFDQTNFLLFKSYDS